MSSTDKKCKHTVTDEDYRDGMAQGLTDEEMLRPGTYSVVRSRFVNRRKESKSKVSIYIDNDVLSYFRARAEQPNSAPYQTQINNELRRVMESDSNEAASLENDILNNVEFLKALKAKLEKV